MPYDKNKVTISLEMYEGFKTESEKLKAEILQMQQRLDDLKKEYAESDLTAYKKALYAAISSLGGENHHFHSICKMEGVDVFYQNPRNIGRKSEEWEGVFVSFKKDKDGPKNSY